MVQQNMQYNIKFIDAQQAKEAYKCKNIREKLYKCSEAIWYSKTCSTTSNSLMFNRQKKHIHVKSLEKNCISAVQQYGATKHAVQHQIH